MGLIVFVHGGVVPYGLSAAHAERKIRERGRSVVVYERIAAYGWRYIRVGGRQKGRHSKSRVGRCRNAGEVHGGGREPCRIPRQLAFGNERDAGIIIQAEQYACLTGRRRRSTEGFPSVQARRTHGN